MALASPPLSSLPRREHFISHPVWKSLVTPSSNTRRTTPFYDKKPQRKLERECRATEGVLEEGEAKESIRKIKAHTRRSSHGRPEGEQDVSGRDAGPLQLESDCPSR